jgi:hypothetical protein
MGRQFRFYLIPSDVEDLIAELRLRHGAKLIKAQSEIPNPSEIHSPFEEFAANQRMQRHIRVYCYLSRSSDTNIKMWYIPNLEKWSIRDEGSELIQFSGCDYDGSLLQIGRFHLMPDMLIGDTIWRQRKEFTDWADGVFRTAKRLMRYSKSLDAYVGNDADKWKQSGGRFVSLFKANGEPVYANE